MENTIYREVADRIYRIQVPLPNNPLRATNSYFIRGDHRDLLIDTGFCLPVCRQALEEGLNRLGSDPDRRDILITHVHSDHAGLARELVGKGCRIYMGDTDLAYLRELLSGNIYAWMHRRYQTEGFPRELFCQVEEGNPARAYGTEQVDEWFCGISDRETLQVGEYELQALKMPGHTPGCMMLWEEKNRIMFTGDHVLFDISPNITAWSGVDNALKQYMDSLNHARDYPVVLALPGHRESGNYEERIRELLWHHEKRLEEVLDLVRNRPGMSGYEIASRMRWRIRAKDWEAFPVSQKWFALGECLSHLDYLRQENKIAVRKDGEISRYDPV